MWPSLYLSSHLSHLQPVPVLALSRFFLFFLLCLDPWGAGLSWNEIKRKWSSWKCCDCPMELARLRMKITSITALYVLTKTIAFLIRHRRGHQRHYRGLICSLSHSGPQQRKADWSAVCRASFPLVPTAQTWLSLPPQRDRKTHEDVSCFPLSPRRGRKIECKEESRDSAEIY